MKRLVATLLAITALVLAGCSSSGSKKPSTPSASALNDVPSGGTFQGVGVVPARARPSFTLTDTSGATFPFGVKTSGRATLLYFGYTNCPDVCPETMADVRLALTSLPVATQEKVDVVFVSTDVKHDTPAIISKWLSNFSEGTHATFVGLHGTQAEIDAAQASAHILVAEDDGETHSAQMLLYGADNYARDSFIPSTNPEQKAIAHDLPLVLTK